METRLSFSTSRLSALHIQNTEYKIGKEAIVYNLSNNALIIDEMPKILIKPWTSALVSNTTVKAENAMVIEILDKEGLASECISKWENYNELDAGFPAEKMLFKSAQLTVMNTSFNPQHFQNSNFSEGSTADFEVKLNMWYTPSNNDCMIHNVHDFFEIHTQVYGTGYLQSFKNNTDDSLIHNYIMVPGNTHDPIFSTDQNSIIYPWHRYLSGTDCIWMAVEFHPVKG